MRLAKGFREGVGTFMFTGKTGLDITDIVTGFLEKLITYDQLNTG
jgi:hypothetical protein